MGCGVSRFEPPEGATAEGQQPTTNANVDADDAPPSSADARKNENAANPVGPASTSRLRGLRKIKADVNAFRRNHHHNHQVAAVVDGSPRTSVSKDGLPLVVVVNKAGGEKTSSAKDGSNRSGGGHREDSIFVSVSSPSFRVYCVKDVFPPLDDHHHHHDQQSHDDPHEHYHPKGDEGEKENKIPTNDGSNKMKGEEEEEGNRRKKKGGTTRGRGIRSVLLQSRGGGGASGSPRGIRHILRFRNHSSNHLLT